MSHFFAWFNYILILVVVVVVVGVIIITVVVLVVVVVVEKTCINIMWYVAKQNRCRHI